MIDTPGFDDTIGFRDLASWLTKTYAENIKLSGIIYLHRIANARFSGHDMRSLRVFKKLCGDENLASVVLATTFWNQVEYQVAETRETQLLTMPEFWGGMVSRGSRVFRHDAGASSGASIVQQLLDRRTKPVYALQHEMVNRKMMLDETAAGMEMVEEMERNRQRHESMLKLLEKEMQEAVRKKDVTLHRELEQEHKWLEAKIEWEQRARKTMQVGAEDLWKQRVAKREK